MRAPDLMRARCLSVGVSSGSCWIVLGRARRDVGGRDPGGTECGREVEPTVAAAAGFPPGVTLSPGLARRGSPTFARPALWPPGPASLPAPDRALAQIWYWTHVE